MAEPDPARTQRDAPLTVMPELIAAGFEDVEEIGRGGFGVVYRCRQNSLDREVAVKVLTGGLNSDSLARFMREEQATGRLTGHPNIVSALQVGATASGRPFIVMPYYSRQSLESEIRRDGPLGWPDALRLGVKMAGALETAHRLGILHRDVKPANILLSDYGEPQLSDFGIARFAGGFETTTATITGSPAFTAPEVLEGQRPTPLSDIYSLGATLFCALTGHAAFERRNDEEVVAQFLRITSQPTPDLREHNLPEDVCAAVEKAMCRDPRERPRSAAAFGEELRRIERDRGCTVEEMALHSEHTSVRLNEHVDAPSGTVPADVSGHTGDGDRSSSIRLVAPGMAGKLPLELTSFVGRRRELAEAKRLLSVSRLETLTGTGGVGKTRLALRMASEMRRGFDGLWLVELSDLREASMLVEVVANALKLRDSAAKPTLDTIIEFLLARRALIVFDNCEHLVDEVAALVATLLHACPELRILATSRQPLGVDGEVVVRVPPLAAPDPRRPPTLQGLPGYDAVTLFSERAVSNLPDFTLTEDNKDAVTRICSRLDGLPLPIELAAARLRAMSATQILEHLDSRYQLLTRGARTAPTRQQTLRLCVDWSYELCTPEEKQLWARLAVFSGGFELDTAEAVCAGDLASEDLLEAVASLVDKSILIREEPGTEVRYRLLETLREYGREKLQASGEYGALRRKHRDWFARLASQAESDWISARQLEWIRRLERELPNLRDALEYCVTEPGEGEVGLELAIALCPFWYCRGLFNEARRWMTRALHRHDMEPDTARIKALCEDSALAGREGDFRSATASVEEATELGDRLTDLETQALIPYADGLLALFRGDVERAMTCLESALARCPAEDNLLLRIRVLNALAVAYGSLQHTTQALGCHEEVVAITEPRGESVYLGRSLWSAGVALRGRENHDHLAGLLRRGLHLARRVDDPFSAARCLEALAWIAADEHREERAAVLMGAAETVQRSMGAGPIMFPNLQVHQVNCENQCRRVLGKKKYDAAYRTGSELHFEAAIAMALDEKAPALRTDAPTVLTRREREVADLVGQGLTNKAIAERLVISHRTAQGHVEHILAKLGFTSRTQIAAWVSELRDHP